VPVVRLEAFDCLNFQGRSRDLKARNFPKYATSARNLSGSSRSVSVSLRGGEILLGRRPLFFFRSPSSPSPR